MSNPNPKNKRAKKKREELAKEQRAREMMQESANKLNGMMSETVTKDGDKTRNAIANMGSQVVNNSNANTDKVIEAFHKSSDPALRKAANDAKKATEKVKRELCKSTRKVKKKDQKIVDLEYQLRTLRLESRDHGKKVSKMNNQKSEETRQKETQNHERVPVNQLNMSERTAKSYSNHRDRICNAEDGKKASAVANEDPKEVRRSKRHNKK